MSSEFVGYLPEIETIDLHLAEALEQIIDFVEKKGRESPTTEGSGRAVRAAHAKSFGLVKAEAEILTDAPAAYAQGIYGTPGRHGALIRFWRATCVSPRGRRRSSVSSSQRSDRSRALARPSTSRGSWVARERSR